MAGRSHAFRRGLKARGKVMLTDLAVKRAKPKDGDYELAAGGCPGLKLRITPNGAKSWTLRYRTAGGQRRITIGQYPTMKLSDRKKDGKKILGARSEGLAVLARVAKGEDPSAKKAEERGALRMVDLLGVDEKRPGWYLEEYVKTAGRIGTSKTPESIKSDEYRIDKHLRSRRALMRKRVDAVTVGDLNKVKRALSQGAWGPVRNILNVCFRHAEEIDAIAPGTNPAARTTAPEGRRLERYLTPAERKRLDKVLAAATDPDRRGEGHAWHKGRLSAGYARTFRLLLLTGMRLGEVLSLRWEQIDWMHEQLALPASKTGSKRIPLTPQALSFLRTEQGGIGRVGLACATDGGKPIHPNNIKRAWRRIRETAKLEDVRLHDLRHSWASDAVSAGVSLAVVGAVLGHKLATTTQRYAHLHDAAIREGVKTAGDAIERATEGRRQE